MRLGNDSKDLRPIPRRAGLALLCRQQTELMEARRRGNDDRAQIYDCSCADAHGRRSRGELCFGDRHIREAARLGANIVCLPEFFRTQYFCQREDLQLFDLAEPIPGPSTSKLAEVAREAGVAIIASLFERRAPGLYHNTAVTLGADGQIAGIYRKMHIPDDPLYYEKYYFTPGDLGFQAVDTAFGRVGTLVCWDQWYPEGARLTALQGAEVLFYPTAIGWHPAEKDEFGEAQYDAWRTIQRAHAIANGVYVAAVNRVGQEHGDMLGNRAAGPGLEFWGGSFIADPFGRVIAKACARGRGDSSARSIRALIEETRRNWPFLRDRRVDAYAPISQRFIDPRGARRRRRAGVAMPEQHAAKLGYRMPAEWEPHEATWLAWPHNPEDWPGKFRRFRGSTWRSCACSPRMSACICSSKMRRCEKRVTGMLKRAGANLDK